MRAVSIAALLCALFGAPAAPALAAPKCDTDRLEGTDKRVLALARYGSEQHDDRRITCILHAWQGTVDGPARILTFTEIPGTSGPN